MHRIQGHTIEKPKALNVALDCWPQPGMIYGGLSRAKSSSQLCNLDKFPVDKVVPCPNAIVEIKKLQVVYLSLPCGKSTT